MPKAPVNISATRREPAFPGAACGRHPRWPSGALPPLPLQRTGTDASHVGRLRVAATRPTRTSAVRPEKSESCFGVAAGSGSPREHPFARPSKSTGMPGPETGPCAWGRSKGGFGSGRCSQRRTGTVETRARALLALRPEPWCPTAHMLSLGYRARGDTAGEKIRAPPDRRLDTREVFPPGGAKARNRSDRNQRSSGCDWCSQHQQTGMGNKKRGKPLRAGNTGSNDSACEGGLRFPAFPKRPEICCVSISLRTRVASIRPEDPRSGRVVGGQSRGSARDTRHDCRGYRGVGVSFRRACRGRRLVLFAPGSLKATTLASNRPTLPGDLPGFRARAAGSASRERSRGPRFNQRPVPL